MLTAKIKLPELIIYRQKIGNNRILQLAQNEEELEVKISPYRELMYLLQDSSGSKFYLKLPKSKVKTRNKNVLKVKNLSDIRKLNEKTKLDWECHISQNIFKKPSEIIDSWRNVFYFREENAETSGLRKAQLGAIHSIASRWSIDKYNGTIVMPTGTGKTEVMLATLVYNQCQKVLVLVPSTILRKQIFKKFTSLGCLRSIGVLSGDALNPRVAIIESGIRDLNELKELIDSSNVIVATAQALHNFSNDVKKELANSCSHLFIDEAHHVPAKTWTAIKELFKEKHVLQFTATPFRRDNQKIDGDIFYNYPLGMAQDDGYFKKINLVKVQEIENEDEKLASYAIKALKDDLLNKKDHLLMARCKNKDRATEVLKIYQKLAPEFKPQSINSDLTSKEIREKLEKINNREARIIVCVDMLGEGFDLPNLKIASMHDIHKSLAITLQFVGRFTRSSKNVGDATMVINTADPHVNKELEILYSDDTTDWNKLLKEKSESTIQKEIDFHEFINSFTGELSKYISLWNLRPAYSTLVYETDCSNWLPKKFIEVMPKRYKYWHDISDKENILVIVISREDDVSWGRYRDIKNHQYDLFVIHWDKNHKALFINSSNYDTINCEKLAELLCGDTTKLKSGQKVFNIYSGIERTLARNVGVSTVGKISYTMHFGSDITSGLSKVDKALGVLNNIFGWGYENGDRVARGCSAKRGKIWSIGGGSIIVWKQWCHEIADKIFDDKIEEAKIIQDFLRPQELTERYPKVPLSAEWSENMLLVDEENVTILFGDTEYKIYDVNIDISDYADKGPILFKVYSNNEESIYKIEITSTGYKYTLVKGKEVKIRRYSGDMIPLTDYVKKDPITILYNDGTFSYNNYHVPTPKLNTFFDINKLKIVDWTGTDIQIESLGKDSKLNSIQHKISELVKEDYEIIFNDDASGEAADIIALRQESNDSFKMHLIHCKFSSDKSPGSRIDDFYALCGQAQKCIRWKHNGMDFLSNHIKKREENWKKEGKTRFIKGNMADINKLKKFSRFATKFIFEVSIVQPGLSKASISDDIIQLLGSTEDYLLKTSGSNLNVFCSK